MTRNKKDRDEEKQSNGSGEKPALNLSKETKRGIVVVGVCGDGAGDAFEFGEFGRRLGEYLFKFLNVIFGVMVYIVRCCFDSRNSLFRQTDEELEKRGAYLRTYLGAILLTGSIAGSFIFFPWATA